MNGDRLVVRARGLGGLWIPLALGFIVVWGGLMAFVARITTHSVAFRLWLVVIVIFLASAFGFELIVRRTFVELAGGRIRYFFREQRVRGDRPLSTVRSASATPAGGIIAFDDGDYVTLQDDVFSRRDIGRLLERIQVR